MPDSARELHLARRPRGMPVEQDFRIVNIPLGEPGPGQFLARVRYLSVDPALRPRLDDAQPLDMTISGLALAEVVSSRCAGFAKGDLVMSRGYRDWFLSDGAGIDRLERYPDLPDTIHLHALGYTGLTAYAGLKRVAAILPGDCVFVSTAAGAVGSIAAQIAKLHGCHVIGSTGSAAKAAWLRDVCGLDGVIDYRVEPIGTALRRLAPDGIDVYFDNVGGDHLIAALDAIRLGGRVALCGMISGYNDPAHAPGIPNLFNAIYRRVMLRGFTASEFLDLRAMFVPDMLGWLRAGRIHFRESVHDGLASVPAAIAGLLAGTNIGKTIVRLDA